MIDTHAHLYLDTFSEDLEAVIARARAEGIHRIYLPNIDSEHTAALKNLVALEDQLFYPMMGLHPCSVKQDSYRDELAHVTDEISSNPGYYCAIGEIGVDLYWDKSTQEIQEEAYREQIDIATDYNLPIIIHSRDSLDITISIMEEKQRGNLKGIFHCFNGTVDQGKRIIDLGFNLGIGGVVTFKNAGVDKVVAELPLESMVLETDAPYLTPAPYRGKRNESSFITYVATRISELHNITRDEVIIKTTETAISIFS